MFFNPDGAEAFCGNGTRCAARYAVARGLDAGPRLQLATSVGPVEATQEGDKISLVLRPPEDRGEIALHGPDADYRGRFVLAGVPHVVLPVQGIETWPLARIAPILRNDPSLGPDGANVNVVASDAAGRIRVRTWERGVEGETLACGTGAVAVAFAARLAGAPERVTILPASGIPLTVDLPGDPAHPRVAVLTGDARFIFEGELAPDGIVSP
jgi:diaminopimelate epimerase